jgi:uncharacterized protein YciI
MAAAPQHYLYRIRPTRIAMLADKPTPEEEEVLGAHFAYLQELAAAGVVLMAGRNLHRDERSFGLVVFAAPDDAAARRIMNDDPGVRAGVFAAELFPFRVALLGAPPGGDDTTE